MNLTFTDVSASFKTIAQKDYPSDAITTFGNSGAQKQVFSDKLDETINSIDQSPEDVPVKNLKEEIPIPSKEIPIPSKEIPISSKEIPISSKEIPGEVSGKLNDKNGYVFVSELKTVFLAISKGNLKDISIDAQGLETLKKMLQKAGFGETEIEDLMAELSDKLNEGTLTLDEVFDKLFEMPFEIENLIVEETTLESFEVPFLESILVSLGIPQETIQQILSEADRGEKGISLDLVIERLQQMQKKGFYSHQSYQVPKTESPIQMLSQQLGLDLRNTNPDIFTLNDVVRSLEDLRQNKEQQLVLSDQIDFGKKDAGADKSEDLLNALFKSLKSKNEGSETRNFEFSTEKIKEKFENPMMVTGDNEVGKKSLFDLGKGKKNMKNSGSKEVFKEVEAIVGQRAKETPATREQFVDVKNGAGKLTGVREKNMDQSPIAVSDSKIGDSSQKIDVFKNRVPAKPLPTHVTQQVSKNLVRAIDQGETSLKIQLKPPELGRMLLTIINTGNSIRVSIVTENHAAKEIMTQNVTELRTLLSNSGVNLERFEVDMSSNFRQSMADARQQTGHSGKRNRNQTDQTADSDSNEGIDQGVGELNGLDPNGSVHLVA